MGFAHQKQLTIMNNLANVDTPGYKRQGVPEEQFVKQLEVAIEERRQKHPGEFSIKNSFDIVYEGGIYPVPRVKPAADWGPERHDENSVTPEKEMVELSKNTLLLESMQKVYKKKYDMLRQSLRDRVG